MRVNKKILGIVSVLGISVVLFLLCGTSCYSSIGEKILTYLGIKVWTSGETRFNLGLLYATPFIIIGSIGVRKFLYTSYPKIRKKGLFIVIGIVFLLNTVTCNVLKWNKSVQKGLNAIQFIGDQSRYEYDVQNGELLKFKAQIKLKNYSVMHKSCHIACYLPLEDNEFFQKQRFIGYKPNTSIPLRIEIPSKSEIWVEVDLRPNQPVKFNKESGGGGGIVKGITLYNQDECIVFDTKNLFGKDKN